MCLSVHVSPLCLPFPSERVFELWYLQLSAGSIQSPPLISRDQLLYEII